MKRWILLLSAAFALSLLLLMRPRTDNADGRTLAVLELQEMAGDVIHYFKVSDAADWQATCDLQSVREIWASLRKKVSVVMDNDAKLIDVWGDPYFFEVTSAENPVVIRISSKGKGPPLNGKPVFVELEFDGVRKEIRQKTSWDSTTVFTIEMPTKHDGWTLKRRGSP